MSVLRESRESLVAMLEAFVHDPLISWRLLGDEGKAESEAAAARHSASTAGGAAPQQPPAAAAAAAAAAATQGGAAMPGGVGVPPSMDHGPLQPHLVPAAAGQQQPQQQQQQQQQQPFMMNTNALPQLPFAMPAQGPGVGGGGGGGGAQPPPTPRIGPVNGLGPQAQLPRQQHHQPPPPPPPPPPQQQPDANNLGGLLQHPFAPAGAGVGAAAAAAPANDLSDAAAHQGGYLAAGVHDSGGRIGGGVGGLMPPPPARVGITRVGPSSVSYRPLSLQPVPEFGGRSGRRTESDATDGDSGSNAGTEDGYGYGTVAGESRASQVSGGGGGGGGVEETKDSTAAMGELQAGYAMVGGGGGGGGQPDAQPILGGGSGGGGVVAGVGAGGVGGRQVFSGFIEPPHEDDLRYDATGEEGVGVGEGRGAGDGRMGGAVSTHRYSAEEEKIGGDDQEPQSAAAAAATTAAVSPRRSERPLEGEGGNSNGNGNSNSSSNNNNNNNNNNLGEEDNYPDESDNTSEKVDNFPQDQPAAASSRLPASAAVDMGLPRSSSVAIQVCCPILSPRRKKGCVVVEHRQLAP